MESKALTCLVSLFGFMFFCSFDDDVCDFVAEESACETEQAKQIPRDELDQIWITHLRGPLFRFGSCILDVHGAIRRCFRDRRCCGRSGGYVL